MIKITWRKIEFKEFVGSKKWAFAVRRVDEIPAYLHPIGFGFSIVNPIRQDFWKHPITEEIFAGFLESGSNFHYFGSKGTQRSAANWPEPALELLDFAEGFRLFRDFVFSANTSWMLHHGVDCAADEYDRTGIFDPRPIFCGQCQYLSPKEHAQSRGEAHMCSRYGRRVKHLWYHPELPRLSECNFDPRVSAEPSLTDSQQAKKMLLTLLDD